MKITKAFAFSNFLKLKNHKQKLYQKLFLEFENMSSGGEGGPYRLSHSWTTVRRHYYPGWTDKDFKDVLNDLENFLENE